MGGLFSWLKSFWQQELEMSIVGLQNAGKSTFIQVLQKGEYVEDMIPTVGFNMHKIEKGKVQIKVWDLGGQRKFRPMWERYCRKNDAIVFMVDAAAPKLFPKSKKELHSLLSIPTLDGIPLLLLFNKQDLREARPADEILDALGIKSLKDREIAYYEVSCKEILNIDAALDWLTKHSKS
jgi:ADP-ribosylation factor-like protein 8